MKYEMPELVTVGSTNAVVLGPILRLDSDDPGSGRPTSQGDLALGMDE